MSNIFSLCVEYTNNFILWLFTFMYEDKSSYFDHNMSRSYEITKTSTAVLYCIKDNNNDEYFVEKCYFSQYLNVGKWEYYMTRDLNHPNIIDIKQNSIVNDKNVSLFMNAYSRDLFYFIEDKSIPANKKELLIRFRIVLGITDAVRYLHSKDIIHSDIKPENVLLSANLDPVLIDFGLVLKVDSEGKIYKKHGSPTYAAPELFDKRRDGVDGKNTDIYSLGVVYWTVMFHTLPFDVKGEPYYDTNHSKYVSTLSSFVDLCKNMIHTDPQKRPLIEQCYRKVTEIERGIKLLLL